MTKTLTLQELAIVVAAQNHNPSILTYDFLKYGNFVPPEWELARQPVNTNQASQVIFRNGISLVARPERIIFSEAIGSKELDEIQAAAIARKYIETLPNIDYQAIGINIRGYVTTNQSGSDESYIVNTLLAPGAWQQIGNAPVQAEVQLQFSLERRTLSLSVTDGNLYLTEQDTVPIVLFTGTFSYACQGGSKEDQLQSLHQSLANWRQDLNAYQDILTTKFLHTEMTQASTSELLASSL